jgi:carbonic anhydrase
MGTVEYAVGTLRTPLLLVLGHTRCGAVGAALEGMEAGGHLGALLQMIRPAADVARRSGATGEELAEIAAEANVRFTLRVLEHTCEPVAAAVREGSLLLAGGVYDIAAGRVRWLD